MASPASFKPSTASTPEITITEQEVTGDELHLPAPMSLELPKNLTFHVPQSQNKAMLEPQPMFVIPKGAVESISDEGVCTIPKPSQAIAVPSQGVTETYGSDGELSSSIPIATSPANLKQRPKLLSELRRSISTSHLGHLFHPKHAGGTGTGVTGEKVTSHSGTHSPLPDSPDVQELFKKHGKQTCPDLSAVNKALNSLRVQSRPGDNEFVTSLTRLATSLELSRADSKKALIQAMQARDAGRVEVCRSLCLSIVQNSHADIDTRVYSYNILSEFSRNVVSCSQGKKCLATGQASACFNCHVAGKSVRYHCTLSKRSIADLTLSGTMASPGQAMSFLAEAFKLVQDNQDEHPECEKLLGVIALLKDGAIEKDGGCVNVDAVKANQKLCELSMPPAIPREIVCPQAQMSKKPLEIPKENMPSGILTPKTEKILGWAQTDGKPEKKPKSLWADLSIKAPNV